MVDIRDTRHGEKDALFADDNPHNNLYRVVVPIWCAGRSQDELDSEIGEGYSCGFSAGFERGIITAMLKAEWAQGLYHRLRDFYLATHTPADLLDWDDYAAETTRAIPVAMLDVERLVGQSMPRQCDGLPIREEAKGKPHKWRAIVTDEAAEEDLAEL